MKNLISITFSFLSLFAYSQSKDTLQNTMLSPEQLQEDFQLYRRMLENTHPGLYRYADKEALQNKMDSIASTLDAPKPFYEFYQALVSVAAEIRCTHSYILPTSDPNQYSINQIETIPFYTIGLDGLLYVLFNGTLNDQIKPGFEIVGINGRSIESIKHQLYSYAWSDASIESAKNRFLTGSYFWIFYYTLIDQSPTLSMEFKDLDGQIQQFQVRAQTPKTSMANYKKNPVNKEVLKMYAKNNTQTFKLKFPEDIEKTAFLSVSQFGGKGMNSEEAAQEATRKFMDKAMKKIKKKKAESLIIDLRYNQGGWDVMGIELLSYLVKSEEPFQYFKKGVVTIKDTEFLPYTGYSQADWDEAQKELEEQPDGTFLMTDYNNIGMQLITPKENRFEGDIYFLINDMTGSAASEFASAAKSRNLGTFIGYETNAAYDGGNGSTFIKMTLPNSGIFINSPLVAGYLNVEPQSTPNRGVLPDYQIDFTRDDLLVRYDRQTEFIKDLIRKKDSKN